MRSHRAAGRNQFKGFSIQFIDPKSQEPEEVSPQERREIEHGIGERLMPHCQYMAVQELQYFKLQLN